MPSFGKTAYTSFPTVQPLTETTTFTVNGSLAAHFDACPEAPRSTRRQPSDAGPEPTPSGGGWVSSIWESALGGLTISLLEGEWTVPPVPQEAYPETLYVWLGIEPNAQNQVLQPVLAFGSVSGYNLSGQTFSYYNDQSWYMVTVLANASNNYYYSPPETAGSGDVFYGQVWQTAASSGTSTPFEQVA